MTDKFRSAMKIKQASTSENNRLRPIPVPKIIAVSFSRRTLQPAIFPF